MRASLRESVLRDGRAVDGAREGPDCGHRDLDSPRPAVSAHRSSDRDAIASTSAHPMSSWGPY